MGKVKKAIRAAVRAEAERRNPPRRATKKK